jgi:hypothetical protein
MFHFNISFSFRVMFWTKFKVLKSTKGNNSKIRQKKLWFMCTAHLPIEIYLLTKFHVDFFYNFRDMSRTRFFYKRRNLKSGHNSVMVLWHCTPSQCFLQLYEVLTNYLQGFSSYAPDKKTDGRTDGQGGDFIISLRGA